MVRAAHSYISVGFCSGLKAFHDTDGLASRDDSSASMHKGSIGARDALTLSERIPVLQIMTSSQRHVALEPNQYFVESS